VRDARCTPNVSTSFLTSSRLAALKRNPSAVPSRPETFFYQTLDTTISICREMAYPQMYCLSGPFSKYFNPPALGRCLFLVVYWVLILTALWANTILSPSSPMYAYKWEIVGFRAAWVSVTQLPLIYLLGCKINPISMITGISYERLNWLHRWVARTLFLTVIVHWSFFFREWWIADFVQFELEMMPIVKYGFGSWAVLGWMVLTGFGYIRHLSYEFFVLQHIASFTVLLWLLYVHLPSYARYNVWLSIAFIALDRGGRSILFVLRNLHLHSNSNRQKQEYVFGYATEIEVQAGDFMILTLKNVDMQWRAGQHVFVSIPHCGMVQSHPFTISNLPNQSRSAKFILEAHSGFTRKLLKHAREKPLQGLRALISSPYGSPPLNVVERCDSLILMATSTGASFIVPIMQHAMNRMTGIRRICLYWIVRDRSHLNWFSSEILSAYQTAQTNGITMSVQTYVTRKGGASLLRRAGESRQGQDKDIQVTSISLSNARETISPTTSRSSDSSQQELKFQEIPVMIGRPASLDALIRPTVEASDGETAIVACGGATLIKELRNYTASLSDERAVHKGTGAQGIYLFTETYGW
jgi:ferredoxin-NADP reductase